MFLTTCRLDELLSPTPVGVLTVDNPAFVDSARVGSTAPRTTTVSLTVDGAATTLRFTVSADSASPWITQGLGNGTAPAELTLGLDPTGLAAGEYRDTLRVVNDGPDGRVARIPVTFTILPCATTALDALPAQRADSLTAADCAATSNVDRYSRRFRFTAAAGDSLSLRVLNADFAPRVTIRRVGAMAPLVLADACAVVAGACTGYVSLPETGEFEVEVTSTTAAATGAFVLDLSAPRAPPAPTALSQRVAADVSQSVAAGSTLAVDRIGLQAALSDPDLDSLQLQVELRPLGTPFTNAPTHTTPFGVGATFTRIASGLADNTQYHWQARALDQTGRSSGWVSFGTGSSDFAIGVPEAPNAPTLLVQRKADGTTAVALGGTTNEPIIRLGATATDPDPADQVRLELEVRQVGTAFTNVATHSSALQPSGTAILVSVAGLIDNAQYRWQARAIDQSGRTSAWTPFGGVGAHFRAALPPAQLAFVTQPSPVAAGQAITPAVRVAVQDALGNTLGSYAGNVTVSLNDIGAGATLGGTATVAAVSGIATFSNLTVNRAGSGYTLGATSAGLSATSAGFDVGASAAASLTLGAVPTAVTAGETIAPALTVTVRDAQGNVATGFAGTVSLALAANNDGAALLGTTSVAAVSGVATFADVRIERAATGLVIVAGATGLANVSSAPLNVTAAAPAAVQVVTAPSTVAASGLPLAQQPAVELADAFGNVVTTGGTSVSAAIASGPAGASLTGGSATIGSDGRATFTALAINGVAGSYTLTFGAAALVSSPTAAITISAGNPAQLTFMTAPPATAVNGEVFGTAPVVRLRDASGNPVARAGVALAVSIASGGGTLLGTTSVLTNSAGEATFSDLGITGPVGDRTLRFSGTGLTDLVSGSITLTAGAATTLELQAGDGQVAAAATAVPVPPAVIAKDADGNPVAGVSVSFAVATGGGSVDPVTEVITGTDGIAALTAWTLGPLAGPNTLEASAAGLVGSPITFTASGTAGAASQLAITGGDDLTGPVATTLGTAHEVRVTDATGNPVAGVTITWSAIGGGSVSSPTSVTDADGRATTTRTLGPTAGTQQTEASATLSGGATSVTFTITATVGGATQLALVDGDAQVDTVGATLGAPLRVLVRDALGNPVQGVQITWTVLSGGGVALSPTSLTDVNGIASTSWRLGTVRTATDSTQTMRASGVASPITFIALARPGTVSATQTLVSVAPAGITASRTTPATVTVTARDGFGNPVAGATVALAATGSGNTITQPAALTSTTGVATGAIGATLTGARTITATVNGVVASTTPTLSVTAAPAVALLFTASPGTTTAGSDLAPSPALGVLDSLGNRNFTFTGAVSLAIAANPSSGVLSGTLTRNAVAGIATFPGVALDKAGAGYTLQASAPGLTNATSAAFTVNAGAVSAAQSTVTVNDASIVAGSGTSTITVTARDANDNPIAGATVLLAATGSGNTLTQPVGVTDANGVATGSLSATVTGVRTISATIDATAITQTAAVTVTPAAVSALLSTITGIPSTLVAGVETSSVTVTARDSFGNVIPGATVVIAATGTGNTVTQPTGATNASGVATGSFVSTVAEVKTLSATINGLALANGATVTVNAGAVSAARSLLVAAPDSLVAGEGASTVTVTARDANDNLIAGATVVLAASGGGNTVTQPVAPTNSSGVATGSVASTLVGDKTVSATVNGTPITASALLRVVAGGVSAAQSTVEVADDPVTAGDSTLVTVTARDASGNPVAGAAVVIAASGTGNTLTQPAAVTDAGGVAVGRLGSTVAEAKTISATIASTPVTQTATTTFVPAAPDLATSGVTVVPSSIAADGTAATVTVTARDAFGNAIAGAAVVIAASGSGNTVTQPAATTDASGVATGSVSSTVAETKTITATVNGDAVNDAPTLVVTAAAVSAAQSTVVIAPTGMTAGAAPATITVTARDANGNPVPGLAVTLAATGSGNTLTQPAAVTDASGVATGSLTSTAVGTKTITSTIDGVPVTQTATLTVSAAAIAASTSTLSVASSTIAAGVGSTDVTVTARDGFGNPVAGAAVLLSATGDGNTVTQPASVTNASGVAVGSFSSTVSEAKTLSATAGGVAVTQTAVVTVVPDAASASRSGIAVSPTTLEAGVDTATVTVTARDVNGNPVPGVSVTLEAASGGGLEFVQPASTTDASGQTTGRVSGTLVGAKMIRALLNGVAGDSTVTVTVTPTGASGDSSQVVIIPTSLTAGGSAVTVTLTARDRFGNAVPDVAVVLAATPTTGNTLTQSAATTDASGQITGTFTSTAAGEKVVSATVGGLAVTQTDTVTVTAAAVSAGLSTVSAGTASIAASSGGTTSSITVTAVDQFGNPVPNALVEFSATGSDTLFTPATATTNASGVATTAFSSSTAGSKTISATVAGTPITQTASVTVTAAAVSADSSTVLVSPSSVVAGANTATVTITARDAFGNAVPNTAVSFVATGGGNTLVQPANTDASGVTSGTIASTATGDKIVTATAGGVPITQTDTVTVTPATVSASQSSLGVDLATIAASGGSTPSTVTVTARDAFGNVIPGASVVMAATGSSNAFTVASGTANGGGVFTTAFSSTLAEAKRVFAAINTTPLADTADVTVTPAPASAATSLISASPTSVSADVGTSAIIVQLRDAFNNALTAGGDTVTLATTSGSIGVVTDSGNGSYTATLTANSVGTAAISGTVNAVTITDTATVTITAGGPGALTSTVEVSGASIVAGSGSSTITVTVRDAASNPIAGSAVAIAATGTNNTITQASGSTDVNGIFSTAFSSTRAEVKTISATAAAVSITATPTITVTPAAASADSTTITTASGAITTDGSTTITVQLRDAFGNALSSTGASTVVLGSSIGTVGAVSAGAGGTFSATFSSQAVGTATIFGTLDAVEIGDSASVTVSAGASSRLTSTITPTSATINAGGSTTVTIQMRDQFNNARTTGGDNVVLSATGGSISAFADVGNGTFTATLSATAVGTAQVTATLDGLAFADTATVTVNPAAISADSSSVTVAAGTVVASSGGNSVLVTATARDSLNNPIPALTVLFAASGSGSFANASATTNASGVATAEFSSTVAEANTITVTLGGTLLTDQPVITVTPAAIDADSSSVALTPSSFAAGGSTTVTVTVRDAFNNPISGVLVDLSASNGSFTVTDPADTTNASGVATGSVGSTVTGSGTVSALAGAVPITQAPTLTVTAGGVNGTQSTIQVSPATITASGGSSQSTITVTARDANGNPVSGRTVVLAATNTGGGNTLTQPTDTTDASGQVTGTLSSTVAEPKTISATIDGSVAVAVNQTVTVRPDVFSAAQSLVSATPTSLEAGVDTSTVTVTVRDQFQNPISGTAVTLSAPGTGNVAIDPADTTNASGVTTGRFTATTLGDKTVSALVGATPITQTATITVTAAPISAGLSTVAIDAASLTAGADTATVTVTVRDTLNNLLSGVEVTFGASGSNNVLTAADTTDAGGVATARFTSTTAGARTITATAAGVLLAQTATTTVNAAGVSASVSTVAASPTSIEATTESSTITVTVLDAFGNPISGASVALSQPAGTSVTQPVDTTNASGVITGSLTGTTVGSKTVTATVNGSTVLTQTAEVTVTTGGASASTSTVTALPTAISASNGGVLSTITVTARDAGSNPVAGATVALSSPQGDVVFSSPAVTDGLGATTATAYSTVAGVKEIRATINATVAVTDTATITVAASAPSAANSLLDAADSTITTDETSLITLTVRDEFGNVVDTTLATVVITSTVGGLLASTNQGNGTYTATLNPSSSGTATITATVNGVSVGDNVVVTIAPGAASLGSSTVTPATASATAGDSVAVTIQLLDAEGNALTASAGTVTVELEAGSVGGLGAVTDNNDGSYTARFASDTVGSATVRARLGGNLLTDNAVITVTPAAISAGVSTVVADSSSMAAGDTTLVTVTVTDQFGNPINGVGLTFAVTPDGAFTSTTATTDANGQASVSFTATLVGSKTISVDADGTALDDTPAVSITPGAASAVVFTAEPGPSVVAGASFGASVEVRDAGGNVVTGYVGDVTLALTTGSGTLSGTNTVAVSGGSATFTGLSLNLIGSDKVLTAGSGALTTDATAAFTVTAAGFSADSSALQASAETSVAGESTVTVTATVRDGFGNPIQGATVSFEANGTDDSFTPPAPVSNATGAATTTFSATVAETKVIVASVSAVEITQRDTVTITAAAGDSLAFAQQPTNVTAGDAIAPAIAVQAFDAFGNLATGFTGNVTLALSDTTAGGDAAATLTASTVTVAAVGGLATFSNIRVDSAASGYRLEASASGLTGAVSATFDVAVGTISAATSEITVSKLNVSVADTVTLTLIARDSQGNRITTGGATVTFDLDAGTSLFVETLPIAATDVGNGTYTAVLTADTVGSARTVLASINSVAVTTPSAPAVTVIP